MAGPGEWKACRRELRWVGVRRDGLGVKVPRELQGAQPWHREAADSRDREVVTGEWAVSHGGGTRGTGKGSELYPEKEYK